MLRDIDVNLAKCNVNPVDFTTANIGGAISTGPTYIEGTSVGEIFFTIDPEAVGGSTATLTTKVFVENSSTTDTVKTPTIHYENYIDNLNSNNTVSIVSDSASDDSSFYARVLGFDNSDNPLSIDVTMNGTSTVTSVSNIKKISRVESRSSSTDQLAPTNGTWTITHGATGIGVLPYGLRSASSEWAMIIESSIDGTGTISNAAATPSGTFQSPRTSGTALAFVSDLSHTGGPHAQGIWVRTTVPPATLGSDEIDMSLMVRCKV